jgi:hypothetical protein
MSYVLVHIPYNNAFRRLIFIHRRGTKNLPWKEKDIEKVAFFQESSIAQIP